MVAAHREMEPLRVGIEAALDFAHAPPVNACGIAVLLITGHDAAFAADTLRHIEVEAILFAGLKRSTRDQRLWRQRGDFVQALPCSPRRHAGQQKGGAIFTCPVDEWQRNH